MSRQVLGSDTVHIPATGHRFHRAGCGYLAISGRPLPCRDALPRGNSPVRGVRTVTSECPGCLRPSPDGNVCPACEEAFLRGRPVPASGPGLSPSDAVRIAEIKQHIKEHLAWIIHESS